MGRAWLNSPLTPGGRAAIKEELFMTTTLTKPDFKGPFKEQLSELANLIDWLWTEHGMSFVKAGDDKVYAFGGNGYVLVLDESKWQGLIEFVTPKGALTIKPAEDGGVEITGANQDEQAIKQLLKEGIEGIRRYYENRYWSTPQAP
jgi:hypothetical protein